MTTELANQIRDNTIAVSLSRTAFWTRRKLDRSQTNRAAELFSANARTVMASKKLLDTTHIAYRRVNQMLMWARNHWLYHTTPYPIRGIRLLARERLEAFDQQLREGRDKLRAAVDELDAVYVSELIPQARERLGELFESRDYPASIAPSFGIEWDYPSIEPPDYLRQLHPSLWRAAQAQANARYELARTQAEQEFGEQLARILAHLVDRLEPNPDGSSKTFRDSTVENLFGFLDRYREVAIVANPQLDELVDSARTLVMRDGVAAVRDSAMVRHHMQKQASAIMARLDLFLVDRPERSITLENIED